MYRMELTWTELEDIREALHRMSDALAEHVATLDGVIKTLDGGGSVPLFASGPEGIRAAQEMRKGLVTRRTRVKVLVERVVEELYPSNEDEDEDGGL